MRHAVATLAAAVFVVVANPAAAQSISAAEIDAIGNAMVEAAGTPDAKILLFGRFDDGFAATSLRYRADGSQKLAGGFLDEANARDLQEIWKRERAKLGDDVWWEMVLVVDHGKVDLRLGYADDVDWDTVFSDALAARERETFGMTDP